MEILAVNLREGSVYTSKKLGLWAAGYDNPLELEDPQSLNIYNSRIVYRVITIAQRPLIFEDPEAPRKFSGFCVDVLDEIASMLNFDYEIFTVLDGQKGAMDKDGNWNGMINELVYKRADIAIGSLSVTSQRSKFVDFTVPYYEMSGQTILMKLPTTHTSIFRFLIVFEYMVWLSIIGVYLITSFWLWLLYKLSPFGARYGRANEQLNLRNFTLIECLWFCLIAFTPQGSGEAPSNASGRVMTACWWLFGFILVSSYSANLSAFLTVSRLETPIKSLEDLSKQYKIQYSTINNSNAMNYFKRMAQIERKLFLKWMDLNIFDEDLDDYQKSRLAVWEYPLSDKYTKIWKQMNNVGLLNSTEEALEMIRASENFALMIDGIDAKYLDLTNCDLQIVGEEFNKKPLAFAVQLGSTLKDQMNSAVLQLYNKRILQRFKEKWWANNPNKVHCQVDSVSESINVDNIFGIFIFLFLAALCVVIFALVKRFWSWLKTRN
ncbi:PREDICTED: ionotropic receptor 25a-like [Nicrophorus vespilloides]|uniref:Ionotropic receptor 25a-like n=1 Tax=Nicrophorus vespilloides TaxID=110193 RepID=A0ABM1NJH2_NICVS|nr:PREDICTED: ionotropic receptor 25a-like [Nicrophorus vespilloides]